MKLPPPQLPPLPLLLPPPPLRPLPGAPPPLPVGVPAIPYAGIMAGVVTAIIPVAHIITLVITHVFAHCCLPSTPTIVAQIIAHCHHRHSPPPPSRMSRQ
jgi:hypothetical protein